MSCGSLCSGSAACRSPRPTGESHRRRNADSQSSRPWPARFAPISLRHETDWRHSRLPAARLPPRQAICPRRSPGPAGQSDHPPRPKPGPVTPHSAGSGPTHQPRSATPQMPPRPCSASRLRRPALSHNATVNAIRANRIASRCLGGIPDALDARCSGLMIDENPIPIRYQAVQPSLDERGRRLHAAAEAITAGRGGVAAASRATKVARSTIGRGIKDLRGCLETVPRGLEIPTDPWNLSGSLFRGAFDVDPRDPGRA